MPNHNPKTDHLIPYRWQQGQSSPNPLGRPRKAKPLTEAYEAEVARRSTEVAKSMVDAACGLPEAQHVNVFAAQELANRIEGKVTERLEMSTDTPFSITAIDTLVLPPNGNGDQSSDD